MHILQSGRSGVVILATRKGPQSKIRSIALVFGWYHPLSVLTMCIASEFPGTKALNHTE